MADPDLTPSSGAERAREQMQDAAERARLTFRRLSGLDRSGTPPPETLAGQPLRPWTIPNAIGYVRLALLPVFLVLAFRSDDGTDTWPLVVFAVIGFSDYLDGIAARVTGQYSRMGTLLDPLVDRLLVISGVIVCWHFELLPHWALAERLYEDLREAGLDVIYDDREDVGPGGKFADAELLGAPLRLTVGKRSLASGEVEAQVRRGQESRALPLEGAAPAAVDLWRTLA